MANSEHWTQQRERSSAFWLKLVLALALKLPRSWMRALLYPIVLFYWLISPRQRAASRHYLAQVLRRKPTARDVYRHFFYFAATILDRVYFLTDRLDGFDLTIENLEPLQASLAQYPAQLFLGAHFGSLDAVRALSVKYFPRPLKAVVKLDQNQTMVQLFNALNPQLSEMLIAYNGMETIFDIHEALTQQVSVAMLKDRQVADEACVKVRFFDDWMAVPISGFKLAKRLGVPISVFFGRYEGGQRYVMVSELLPIEAGMTIQQMAQLYMDKVAQQCRIAPFNWFNFYPYWLSETSRPEAADD
jgi:predicted LPLAT superfamily acyltransferase